MAHNKPVKVFRFRGISASVFENTTHADNQPVRFFKVSLQRAFKQDGEFRAQQQFRPGRHSRGDARAQSGVAIHPRTGGRIHGRDKSRVVRSSHTTGCSLPGREQLGVGFISFPPFRMETKRRKAHQPLWVDVRSFAQEARTVPICPVRITT